METAGEIIFFCVTRMIMLGIYRTGRIPFRQVYLHGLVLDGKGHKMSKSKGNVINPMELTAKYGTDALRMALVSGNTPGTSLALSEDKIRGYRNFATKIWNIARFIILQSPAPPKEKPALAPEDESALAAMQEVKKEVTAHLDAYEFHLAAEKIYHYAWHTFADQVIEGMKPRLQSGDEAAKNAVSYTLHTILMECLKMLHPFTPYVTEAVYQKLKTLAEAEGLEGYPAFLMVRKW
jgi:valyl-tRNA synthetase